MVGCVPERAHTTYLPRSAKDNLVCVPYVLSDDVSVKGKRRVSEKGVPIFLL